MESLDARAQVELACHQKPTFMVINRLSAVALILSKETTQYPKKTKYPLVFPCGMAEARVHLSSSSVCRHYKYMPEMVLRLRRLHRGGQVARTLYSKVMMAGRTTTIVDRALSTMVHVPANMVGFRREEDVHQAEPAGQASTGFPATGAGQCSQP